MKHFPAAFAAASLVMLAPAAPAQPGGKPFGPPPEFGVVAGLDPTKKTVTVISERLVPVKVQKFITEAVLVNGQQVVVTKAVEDVQHVSQKVQWLWSPATHRAADVAGNPLTADAVLERLKVGDGVLVMPKNQRLDPIYHNLFRKNAITLEVGGIP